MLLTTSFFRKTSQRYEDISGSMTHHNLFYLKKIVQFSDRLKIPNQQCSCILRCVKIYSINKFIVKSINFEKKSVSNLVRTKNSLRVRTDNRFLLFILNFLFVFRQLSRVYFVYFFFGSTDNTYFFKFIPPKIILRKKTLLTLKHKQRG